MCILVGPFQSWALRILVKIFIKQVCIAVQPSLFIFCLRKNVYRLHTIKIVNISKQLIRLTLTPLRLCKDPGFFKN